MKLITGTALDPTNFFQQGSPKAQGSSFDLTIGKIYDSKGKEVSGLFTLPPGHMVLVVSAEVFNLSDKITGHVTYKTGLTRIGIWALTVGIVDPGWDGPITTTLLNFSKIEHTIHIGDPFLRVSLFEHDPVAKVRKAPPIAEYLREVQSLAASQFPPTFLNGDQIAHEAGKTVMQRIRNEGLAWLGLIALIFTLIQIFAPPTAKFVDSKFSPTKVSKLIDEIDTLKSRLNEIDKKNSYYDQLKMQINPTGGEVTIDKKD